MSATAQATAHDSSEARLRAGYGTGLVVLAVGVAISTIASQAHHHYAPADAGGWRELPTYLVAGVVAYGVGFVVGVQRVRRSSSPRAATTTALSLALLGAVLAPLSWWNPIPLVLGAAAILIVRDGAARPVGMAAKVAVAAGALAVAVPVAVLVVRVVHALSH